MQKMVCDICGLEIKQGDMAGVFSRLEEQFNFNATNGRKAVMKRDFDLCPQHANSAFKYLMGLKEKDKKLVNLAKEKKE